ncbi:MAG: IS3 family transposase [Bacteroidetes bacterium]|nr:IS3 family transposase [Bacteroidota bacterium]
MNKLYSVVGVSRQSVHQYACKQVQFEDKLKNLLAEAEQLRRRHPGCGVEKMYNTLKPEFIGRDRFVEAFMNLGFRLKRSKNYRRTTRPVQSQYVNLIKGLKINAPSEIWQSDITYYYAGTRFYYIVFILDVYTKKIVGYCLSDHMRASSNVEALKSALAKHKPPRIHHSDKGSQYIYRSYIKLLLDSKCAISMANSCQDNAYAERINRTIKEEYLDKWKPQNYQELRKQLSKAVKHYNSNRIHKNLNKRTPIEFETLYLNQKLKTIPEIIIFDNENN